MHPQRVDAGCDYRVGQRVERPSGSCSSTPSRHFTVTGMATAAHGRDAFADQFGLRIRQAPNVPDCTRSDGQPTLRLISP